jgi:hypothetical protein
VVVAVATVWMVQMATDQVVRVVAVRHRFVTAARVVLVTRLVTVTSMVGSAGVGVRIRNYQGMIVVMALVLVVHVAVVQIVGVTVVFHGSVAAARAVLVFVVFVNMMILCPIIIPPFP